MTRTRNEEAYQARKDEITRQAARLLGEHGFEKFSLNKVIQQAGLTKGAFFHYFSSKDELISSIVSLMVAPVVQEFNKIADDEAVAPREKIHRMFAAGYALKSPDSRETQQLVMLLVKPENRIILQMITDSFNALSVSIYARVFRQGNQTGDFRIAHPEGSAYLFTQMIAAVNREIGRVAYTHQPNSNEVKALRETVDAFEMYAQNLLNLADGERLYQPYMSRANIKSKN